MDMTGDEDIMMIDERNTQIRHGAKEYTHNVGFEGMSKKDENRKARGNSAADNIIYTTRDPDQAYTLARSWPSFALIYSRKQ